MLSSCMKIEMTIVEVKTNADRAATATATAALLIYSCTSWAEL